MSNRKIPSLAKLQFVAPIGVDVPALANLTAEDIVKQYIAYNPYAVANLLQQHALQNVQPVVGEDDVIGICQLMHPWVVDDRLYRYASRCLMKNLPYELQVFIRGAFDEAIFTVNNQGQSSVQSWAQFSFFNKQLLTSFGSVLPIAHSVRSLTDTLLTRNGQAVNEMQDYMCALIVNKLGDSNEFGDDLDWPFDKLIQSWGMTLGDFAAHVLTLLTLICFYSPEYKYVSPYIFKKVFQPIDDDRLFNWMLTVPELDAGRLLGAFVSDEVHQRLANQPPSLTRTALRIASFHENFSKLEASAQLFAHQPNKHRIDSAFPTMQRLILHSVRPRDQLDFVCEFLSLNGWMKDVDETKRELDMMPYEEPFDRLEHKAAESLRMGKLAPWYKSPLWRG